ncbi:NADH:flavin oxidoreductase [Desulfosporosinus sp. Sb-LF]|uniref:NADH:flavin oxidoreductase n=1 Tax=Desulfosporosinus sp. Sb-LF TaxID=2560027 RepID=UPI00107FBE7A|nr:NADH:flavin oxidoreductase [Desulfosporosinus sp. Sb-LF]TGE32456.1 NADH:flavin oxidoreductase [Desulfosporosinus sp. Sb-LF]
MFSKNNIKNLKIKNRIVLPPMVIFNYLEEDGFVSAEHVNHYEERARGGIGLIIVEATCVNANGRLAGNQLRLWSDKHIVEISKIVKACHNHGAKVIVQIHHAGLKTVPSSSTDIVAPSIYEEKSNQKNSGLSARSLTITELHELQNDFVDAALRAKKAGADGVELHGAHGYLISQFLSPLINKREDSYGGNLINRTRFTTEIITGIREVTGKDFMIGCRMGCNEPDLKTSIEIAKEFEKAGADLLHVSIGFDMTPSELPVVPEEFKHNWVVYGGTEIRRNVNIPVIVVNGIKTPEQASDLIKNDQADFVAVGRSLLVDPEWVNKAQQTLPIKPCLNCKICQWFKTGKSCPGKTSSIS